MGFTFSEWQKIRHALDVALRQYKQIQETCKKSDEPTSMWQIYQRQIEEVIYFCDTIDNTVL